MRSSNTKKFAEADIKPERDLSAFKIKEKELVTSNTIKRGKSRLICWFNSKILKHRNDLEEKDNDILVFEYRKVIIVGLYRPFKCYEGESLNSNFKRLMHNIELIAKVAKDVVIIGDMNVNWNNLNRCSFKLDLEKFIDENSLDQVVDFNTRFRLVQGTMQESCLDIVMTNMTRTRVESQFHAQSDHLIITVSEATKHPKPTGRTQVTFLDWKWYSKESIMAGFNQFFRGINIYMKKPDLINNRISVAICSTLNVLVPKRTIMLPNPKSVTSSKIQTLKNRKTRAFKKWKRTNDTTDYERLKSISRKLNYEIKKIQKTNIASQCSKGPKQMWQCVNETLGKDGSKLVHLVNEGKKTTDRGEIANIFASTFIRKVNGIVEVNLAENFVIPNIFGTVPKPEDYFTLKEVSTAIRSLKRSKALSIDEIPSLVVKDLGETIVPSLAWLFNNIVETECIPKAWKISRIVPIHKKGETDDANNYRPVSNIPVFSKIFERCLVNKLLQIDNDKIFGTHQHAYRSGSSTTTACLTLQDFVCSEMEQNKLVLLYSADLSAAFDLLRASVLVKQMLRLNLSPKLISLVYNFLTNRCAYVDIEGSVSDLVDIHYGCVQGSVMGPILFNLYTSQLVEVLGDGTFSLSYADDSYVAISCSPNDLDETLISLQEISSKHTSWLRSLGMSINPAKTEFTIFGYQGPRVSFLFDGTRVHNQDNIKVLGVIFQSNMRWTAHVNKVIKSINYLNYSLRVLNIMMTKEQNKRVINAHIMSRVAYSIPVWGGNLNSIDKRRLNSLIFKTIRMHCRDFNNIFSNRQLCEMTGLRSLDSIRILADSLLLHKIVTMSSSSHLTMRLIQQTTFQGRCPNRLIFFDFSTKRIGRQSLINRAKRISELIPFPWIDLSPLQFKIKMKTTTPIYINH